LIAHRLTDAAPYERLQPRIARRCGNGENVVETGAWLAG
jgi:hypothetical protein